MSRDFLRLTSLFVAAGLLTVSVACGKKAPDPPPPAPPQNQPPAVTNTPPPPPPTPNNPPPTPAPPVVDNEETRFARMSLEELNRSGALEDVFFEYDKADLSDRARASLQKNADYLKKWTSTRVTVEGHADSRGTNEYNLALGERRAAAIRDYLASLGIPAARMAVVSRGEESPVCTDDAESCWSKNRRGAFVFTAK
ncbi:MAG TPA: peptidoglycan-associated lipoprotein Pal [Vicinamibacterales bacterium]|nr:peptidoglycan-associated lipoprotein Pal [Vicinamibacterales bacterium]